jgi:acyl carrier protein
MSEHMIKNAFVEGLGISADTNFSELKYGETDGWDSIGHMALVSCIEEVFGIMLETDDVIDMKSFNKAKDVLAKYGITFT